MHPPSTRQRLAGMIGGYYLTQAVHVAARLGIADLLLDGPRSVEQLARAADAHPPSLYRLLRTLAAHGLFREDGAGRFGLTELADGLRADVPGSQRAAALAVGETHYAAFGELLHSVRTGQPGFERAFGVPLFDYFAHQRSSAESFDAALAELRSGTAEALLEAFDFTGAQTVVDVGGGTGGLLSMILTRHSELRGVLIDLPQVIERAREQLRAARLEERCALVAGDFFASVPPGADVYVLRHIVHDWDDDRAARLLRNCRTAMHIRSKLLLVESIVPPGNEPAPGKFLDLVMLALTGGRERTEPEYESLLAAAGLRLSRVMPTAADVHLIEASREQGP